MHLNAKNLQMSVVQKQVRPKSRLYENLVKLDLVVLTPSQIF